MIKEIKKTIKKNHKFIVGIFFILFFLIGLFIFNDYGLSWDEETERSTGYISYNYVIKGDKGLLDYIDGDHGVAFQLPLIIIEKMLNLKDSRNIFLMRHFLTFLLFYVSVYFFYLICKKQFNSDKIGLIGALFLILSPRIFAHSFYNGKDLPFLSMFIISMYTLTRYLEKKTLSRAALHALICAISIDIRIVGVVIPFVTFLFIFADAIESKINKKSFKKEIKSFGLYFVLLIILIVVFWPWLWKNPLNFFEAFKNMAKFRWGGNVLYFGDYINAGNLPWHYIPAWMIITTPIVYTLFFIIGITRLTLSLIKNKLNFYAREKRIFVFFMLFILPLLAVIILKSVLYDSWRHMFFIYPAFLIISISGMLTSFNFIKTKFKKRIANILRIILLGLIIINLLLVTIFMIRYHPYQNVYFNALAGKNLRENFELDYWGLSYREALEYILQNDARDEIKINVWNTPGKINGFILISEDRKKITYVDDLQDADYFLSNFRWHPQDYPYQEIYNITVGGSKIMAVYDIKNYSNTSPA